MEMRIIDANKFRNAWNPDSVIGQTMMRLIDEQPTIDPETLPIVQELQGRLKAQYEIVYQQIQELDRRHKTIDELREELSKANENYQAGISLALSQRNEALSRAESAEARCATLDKLVKEYQEQLIPGYRERAEKAERERDALLKEFAGDCGMCLHYEDCAKKRTSCGGADWEWYGLQKEVQDDG